jgi:hypothetical protein
MAMAMLLLHDDAAAGDPLGEALKLGRLLPDASLDRRRGIHLTEADLQGSLHLVLALDVVVPCLQEERRPGAGDTSAPAIVPGAPSLHGQTGALGEVRDLVRDAEQEPGEITQPPAAHDDDVGLLLPGHV